ncbi:hypothetical protein NON00_12435 [Roseomonas sp. GC11]|uniref:hypothetical protein n=1 Tax=Roseomonas sp. GC11 TaxID=2950546 RepID=UPI00210B8FC4|nr:hypothetical protein [Roseomonas sp. GC11]MCQ4160734.1 hypothetical protein [Roseomonas sp. GC11]
MRVRVGVVLALLLAPWPGRQPVPPGVSGGLALGSPMGVSGVSGPYAAADSPAFSPRPARGIFFQDILSPGIFSLGGGAAWAAEPRPAQRPQERAAPREQEREALIVNELGLGLRELYITPAGSVEPGPDRLGQDSLPTGASLRVPLGRQRLCLFDVRGVLADGSSEEKRGVDLCRSARVVLGDPSAPLREAVVVNDTDLMMRELYAMPSGAGRGPDRLGADTVAPEENFTLRLGRTRECVFDLTAVFEDDSTEERRRVDLCRRNRVVFGDPSLPWREARIVNATQHGLRNLHAVPDGATPRDADNRWGPDRLGATVVEAGNSFRLRIRSRACQVDLRVVYDDDTAEEKQDADLCAGKDITFDGSGIPRPPERAFTVVNRHGAPVQELYASGIDDSDWGDDRLPGGPLERGGRSEVVLRASCEIDLRIVFANGGAEERRGLNICDNGLIVLRPGWTLAERLDQGAGPIEQGPPREGSVRFRNAGPAPVVELYVDAPGAPRGPDRLGSTVLGRGETLDFQPPEGVGCTGHLRAVFRNGLELDRPDFPLCSGNEVTLP